MSNQDEFTKIAQALDEQAVLTEDVLVSSYLEAQAEAFRRLGDLGDDGEVLRMLQLDGSELVSEVSSSSDLEVLSMLQAGSDSSEVLVEEATGSSEFLAFFLVKE